MSEPALLEQDAGQLLHEVLLLTNLAFCGIQEHHWLGSGKFKAEGYSFLYSGHWDMACEGIAFALSLRVTCNL